MEYYYTLKCEQCGGTIENYYGESNHITPKEFGKFVGGTRANVRKNNCPHCQQRTNQVMVAYTVKFKDKPK